MHKILVIEDEQAIRESILDILDAEGFYAIGAENGRIGVQLAQEVLPSLIVCDMMMPELDGRDVLTRLRKTPPTATIPFVFLTARADFSDLRQGMELGADDYLTKPFTRSDLLKTISTRLTKHAVLEEQLQEKLEDLRSSINLSLPHELNTPLNIIANSSSLLIDEYDVMERDEILEFAESIYSSSQRLQRLIQNFLLYAQLEIAASNPERLKALRNSCTSSVKAFIEDIATQKAQQVDRASDLRLELQEADVKISELKLKKILEELIDNAFKFSLPGTLVRVISMVKDNTLTIYIVDSGRGMTAAQITGLGAYMQFERHFYEQQGVGLGLAIAKRLTELHEGQFEVESIAGKQTTVRLVLPTVEGELINRPG